MADTGDRSHFDEAEEITTGELLETSRRLREESRALMHRIDIALQQGGRRPPGDPAVVTEEQPAPGAGTGTFRRQ